MDESVSKVQTTNILKICSMLLTRLSFLKMLRKILKNQRKKNGLMPSSTQVKKLRYLLNNYDDIVLRNMTAYTWMRFLDISTMFTKCADKVDDQKERASLLADIIIKNTKNGITPPIILKPMNFLAMIDPVI